MFKKFLLLTIVISSSFVLSADKKYTCYDKWPDATPPYHFTPNECGPDSVLADVIPNKFGSVYLGEECNKHDRCWMELEELNQYGRCEVLFTKGLIKACNKAEKCIKTPFGKKCIPNPVEIAACQSIIVPAYSSASVTGVFLLRLEKTREEQMEFEACVKEHGYHKRPKTEKK